MIALPGETPTLPAITVAPEFVTVEPAQTAKLAAVPRDTLAWAKEHSAERKNMLKVFKSALLFYENSRMARNLPGRHLDRKLDPA
jgi:hypothetical protein